MKIKIILTLIIFECYILNINIIKGSIKAYLDVFSDYENFILEKMSKLKKE